MECACGRPLTSGVKECQTCHGARVESELEEANKRISDLEAERDEYKIEADGRSPPLPVSTMQRKRAETAERKLAGEKAAHKATFQEAARQDNRANAAEAELAPFRALYDAELSEFGDDISAALAVQLVQAERKRDELVKQRDEARQAQQSEYEGRVEEHNMWLKASAERDTAVAQVKRLQAIVQKARA